MADFFDRELSWLAFNGRVLQEAEDSTVPLLERLRFLAIFSSNLDEFYRVRVASLRALMRLDKAERQGLKFKPKALLREILGRVHTQQERFGRIFRESLLPAMAERGVRLLGDTPLSEEERAFARSYFELQVASQVEASFLDEATAPFLTNKGLYLIVVCRESGRERLALAGIPSPPLERFVEFPGKEGEYPVMFLDDVIRANLDVIFPETQIEAAYAIKLTRDAELYLEDEFSGSLVRLIRESLSRRDTGLPTRFLYDKHMPEDLVGRLAKRFDLHEADLVPGGRYHNFNDLFAFPARGLEADQFPPMPPLRRPELDQAIRLFDVLGRKDVLLHFPYESYDYVVRFLDEAADDPDVTSIGITLYRVSSDSAISRALIRAARAGKHVTAFVEIKARFDEASNLKWAERMEDAGVRVLYSMPGIKVHCKVALVERRESGTIRRYAYFGTGNFNEKTARIYADEGLLTADARLADEAAVLFDHLCGENPEPMFEHLLVAPFTMRNGFNALIAAEAERAKQRNRSGMLLKMNSLEDRKIIRRLYQASRDGVPIAMIVRGICCLIPGLPEASPTISVRSLVGRFLEHARVYIFENGGDERVYLASADWMKRNLSRRIEVAFPIYDADLRGEIRHWMNLQLADSRKARHIDQTQENLRLEGGSGPAIDAQEATYEWLTARIGVS